MLIAGKQTPGASTNVLLSGAIVPQVSCAGHLGVHLSSNLSWTPHITAVLSKAAPLAGILKRLAYRCPPGAHRFIARLYCAIARLRLEYCSPVWGSSCSRQDALSLERLQNSVAHALYRSCHPQSTRPQSTTALKWLGWPTLAWRRRRTALAYLWRLHHGEGPPRLRGHLPAPASERCHYALRNAEHSFEYPLGGSSLFQRSFIPSVLKLFSSLPAEVVACSSLSSFLRLLDRH